MTNKSTIPAWLNRIDHGAIGEARSKAFLMDRFWILERSVDIDGADLIIQRKITGSNLLDKEPPRLGVVQVKFFGDKNTTHYIHKEYLLDNEDCARNEFFVMCHSGIESDAKMYLLTSKEVLDNFKLAPPGHSKEGKYIIPGSKLFVSEEFRISSPKLTLDRIERSIQLASFGKNRRFLSWALPSASITEENIDPIYSEPIDNWWGNIPEAFKEMKKKAQNILYDLDDLHSKYTEIIESSDPERSLQIAEDIEASFKGGMNVYLTLPDDLYDENFQIVVKEHKQKVEQLKKKGLLDKFIEFKSKLSKFISEDFSKIENSLAKDDVYEINLVFCPNTLNITKILSRTCHASKFWDVELEKNQWDTLDVPEYSGVDIKGDCSITLFFLPNRFGYTNKREEQTLAEFFKDNPPYVVTDTMNKLSDFILNDQKS